MIKANELRHGNLVYEVYGQKKTVEEYDFTLHSFHDINLKTSYNDDLKLDIFDELEPIPLTEEWLVRFGFEKHQWKNELWFSIQDLAIEKTEGGFFDRETSTKIDSVHWLQNYTFFKTLQELKLTDK